MSRRTVLAFPALLLAAGLVAGPVASCARNPVTGKNELALVSEGQEIQMGQQAAQEVAQSIGFVDDPELQSYVAGIGKRMAAKSERPDLPWEFHVVNDASVNAFALPGGFIYVTRGLLTHMNSEAELASVIGHEIGHVTARHSVNQISKQQVANIGMMLGMILRPELRNYGNLAEVGMGLLFLKYGRDAERQADELGLRYLTRGAYDPRPMVDVFTTLERVGETESKGRLPSWLSTHPAPEDRRARITQQIQAAGGATGGTI